MEAAATALQRHLDAGGAVYGVTTGLGARVNEKVSDPAGFAAEILRGRATAVGEPLPAEVVRAAMAVRAAGLAAGGAGASPAVAAGLVALLNHRVHPVVPRTGSLGAADLCLLAHVGLVLIGEGAAEHDGRVRSGADALAAAGLRPLVLAPRDGLAICSASAVSVGAAALAGAEVCTVLAGAQVAAALTMEAFRANLAVLDPRVVAARPAPGQAWAADGLRSLLAGGELTEPGVARRLQDPLSIRCVPAIHGAARTALDGLQAAITPELGAAADSPLVLDGPDGPTVVSTANFHGPALSLALDGVAIALAQTGAAAAERIGRLAAERYSGLPAGLAAGPTRSGVAPLEKTARALALSLGALATPRSLDVAVAADGSEDVVTGALPGALRLRDAASELARLLAVELVVAATALDLRGPLRLGTGTERALTRVRAYEQPGDARVDRPRGSVVEALAGAVLAGELSGILEA